MEYLIIFVIFAVFLRLPLFSHYRSDVYFYNHLLSEYFWCVCNKSSKIQFGLSGDYDDWMDDVAKNRLPYYEKQIENYEKKWTVRFYLWKQQKQRRD